MIEESICINSKCSNYYPYRSVGSTHHIEEDPGICDFCGESLVNKFDYEDKQSSLEAFLSVKHLLDEKGK